MMTIAEQWVQQGGKAGLREGHQDGRQEALREALERLVAAGIPAEQARIMLRLDAKHENDAAS
jgi:hypothetical protein